MWQILEYSYLPHFLYFRVTEDEKEIIEELARCQCLDNLNFVRWFIFEKYIDDFTK